MQEKKFYIAGVQHHDLHKVLKDLNEGDELVLVPEPTNKFDPNAIRIECVGEALGDPSVMLGYVPRKFSAEVGALLEVGFGLVECIITKLNKTAKPWEQCEVAIKVSEGEEDYEEEDPAED